MKPGLWEQSITMKSQSGRMEAQMAEAQRQLAAMPPAQRKMVEQMMAQQGVKLGSGGNNETTLRVCISPAMAARGVVPATDGREEAGSGRCTQTAPVRNGDSYTMTFRCTGDDPADGTATYRFNGDGSYSGEATVNAKVDNKPEVLNIQQKGRWIGADCQGLKPLQ